MQLLTLKKKKKEKLVWNQDAFIESTLIQKWAKQWEYVTPAVSLRVVQELGGNQSPLTGTNWKNRFMSHLFLLSFSDTLTPGLPNSSGLIHDTPKRTWVSHAEKLLHFVQLSAAALRTVRLVCVGVRWFQTGSLGQIYIKFGELPKLTT